MKYYYILDLFKEIFPYSNNYNEVIKSKYDLFKKLFFNLQEFKKKIEKIKNESLESLLFFSACIVLSEIPKNEAKIKEIENKDILLDLINFNDDSIYNDSLKNNKDFINKLTKKSFAYIYLLQIYSPSKDAQNLVIDDGTVFGKPPKSNMISMITISQLKYDLYKSLPKYAIKVFFNYKDDDCATTILNTSITIFNEINIFGNVLNSKELEPNNDITFKKRVCLSVVIKHERFTHLKKIFNKNENNYIHSPIGFLNFNSGDIDIGNNYPVAEIGESFESLITNKKRYLIIGLFKSNNMMSDLYDNELWVKENNDELIAVLEKINSNKNNENKIDDLSSNIDNIHIKKTSDDNGEIKIKKFKFSYQLKYNDGRIVTKQINETGEENEFKKKKIQILKSNNDLLKLTHTFKEDRLRKIAVSLKKEI